MLERNFSGDPIHRLGIAIWGRSCSDVLTRTVAVAASCGALLLCGCVSVSPPASWEKSNNLRADRGEAPGQEQADVISRRASLTLPIALLADTQIHESRGTASRYWSLAGDEFVPVTIRTGQQVIGASDLLLAARRHAKALPLTIHLGDAIDVSCESEWQEFTRTMQMVDGRPGAGSWLLAPGNHDGFLVGNWYPQKTDRYNENYWSNVCNVGRATKDGAVLHDRQPKPQLVSDYLKMLMGRERERDQDTLCVSDGVCLSYRIDEKLGWTSYIVQLVRLPAAGSASRPVYMLLFDTSDYARKPRVELVGLRAGEEAAISAGQLSAALSLLKSVPADAYVILSGHHPLQQWNMADWPDAQRKLLHALLADPKVVPFVVTAHTHEGGWYRHQFEGRPIYELNIGSLSDAPLYYRTLAFEEVGSDTLNIFSQRQMLDDMTRPTCDDYRPPAEGSGYAVNDQKSESDRNSDKLSVWRFLASTTSAVRHFFKFWGAKHQELRPQLLTYADVVEKAMPADAILSYEPFGPVEVAEAYYKKYTLGSGSDVTAKLRYLANCVHGTQCSVQEKGNLLLRVHQYFWDSETPIAVREEAHRLRYCAALRSAEESAVGSVAMTDALSRSHTTRRQLTRSASVVDGEGHWR